MADPSRNDEAILAGVMDAVGDIVGRPKDAILPSHRLAQDLGLDSLEFARLIQIVEENTDVRLNDEDAAKVVSVADLIALVRSSVRGDKAAGSL